MAPNKTEDQLARLRAEWAKAPFTARAVAGPYIGPLLDLLETVAMDQRLTADTLAEVKAAQRRGQDALWSLMQRGEAIGGLPDWILEELRPIVQEGANHGA